MREARAKEGPMKLLRSRFGGLYVLGTLFLGASLLVRSALAVFSHALIDTTPLVLFKMFIIGMMYDVVTYFYCVIPVAIFLLAVPERVYHSRATRVLMTSAYLIAVMALVFDVIAEWLFWNEFGTRYNFVSVDYMAYTHQFAGNLAEALPIPILAGFFFAGTATIFFSTRPALARTFETVSSFRQRVGPGVVFVLVPIVSICLVDLSLAEITRNHYNNELTKNGVYSFMAAVRYNTVTYAEDYATVDSATAWSRWRARMERDGARFKPVSGAADPTHETVAEGPEARHNVVVVLCESLGAEFVGAFGSKDGWTPNLDALIRDGLVFRRFYATGTRTDRGIEAVFASLPPTPGRCSIKKPMETNPNALGTLFRRRGYETRFVTGCDATFDNMKGFFEANGFDVVGRTQMARGEVTQENAWGACDGDVFAKILKECDAAHVRGKKFFAAAVTGSNHQPFTVPAKFDPQGEKTRAVAVRYADRAIGDFVAAARSRSWFGDTIFVFVADHCANCAGRAEVSPADFHIPAVIYAPSLVAPGRVDTIASQIDLMPTVLGLMNFRYESRFFGRDALKGGEGRAALSNYQDLVWLEGDRMVLLRGEKRKMLFLVEASGSLRECADDPAFVLDAISCFQTASEYVRSQLLVPEAGPGFFARRPPR